MATQQFIFASGNPGILKTQTQMVILLDQNGNSIDTLGSGGSSVPSVNGITSAVTIGAGSGITVGTVGSTITINANAAAANVSSLNGLAGSLTIAGISGIGVTTAGSTITISGNGGTGAGTITGPVSSTANALVRWSGVTGTIIEDSNIVLDGVGNFTSSGANISLTNSVNTELLMNTDFQGMSPTGQVLLTSSTLTQLQSQNSNITALASGNINLTANNVGSGSGNINLTASAVRTTIGMIPTVSGIGSIGSPSFPFATGFFNQYATTVFSGAINATTYSVNWNNGTSQAIGFNAGFLTGVTVSLVGGIPGSSYDLEVYNNPSGTGKVTWASNIKWQQAISGTLTTSGNAADFFTFYCKPNNVYYGASSYNFF